MSHFKAKLNDLARDLYREYGWKMPDGFKKDKQADRNNYDLSQWQQAKRAGLDIKSFKAMIRGFVERSDNRQSLEAALSEKGLYLARGDRRGFVVIDGAGEIYSLSRYSGFKKKELTDRLGAIEQLPTVDQIKLLVTQKHAAQHDNIKEQAKHHKAERAELQSQLDDLRASQRKERSQMATKQRKRRRAEAMQRAERLRSGVMGFFQKITGKAGKIERQNAKERLQARRRDQAERQVLIEQHLHDRQPLQQQYEDLLSRQQRTQARLRDAFPTQKHSPERESIRAAFEALRKTKEAREKAKEAERNAGKGRGRDFER